MTPIDKLQQTVEAFCQFIEALPVSALVEQDWGPKEVLAHIVYYHENYVAEIEAQLADRPYNLPKGRFSDLNARAAASSRGVPVEELLHHLREADEKLRNYFDTIVVSGDVGVEKPDPRIFDPALAQTQLQPGDALYVGDTVDDVRGARAAGLTPVLIRRGDADQSPVASDYKTDYGDLPDTSSAGEGARVIRSLSELLEIAG